jgi:hypothetical protein
MVGTQARRSRCMPAHLEATRTQDKLLPSAQSFTSRLPPPTRTSRKPSPRIRLSFSNCLRFIFHNPTPLQSESTQFLAPSASESSFLHYPRATLSTIAHEGNQHSFSASCRPRPLYIAVSFHPLVLLHPALPPIAPRGVARDSRFPSVVGCALDYGYGYTWCGGPT